jgi:hypothetical protein
LFWRTCCPSLLGSSGFCPEVGGSTFFRKVSSKTKLYGVTLQVTLRTSALLRTYLIQKPTYSTFLEKGCYVCDVNLLAVMLLKLKHTESEQGKQTIITYVCHCVKACFTAVNIGLAIPRSTFEIPRDYLLNPWLNVATFHPFTRKTSDIRRVLFGICSCGQSPCSFSLHIRSSLYWDKG